MVFTGLLFLAEILLAGNVMALRLNPEYGTGVTTEFADRLVFGIGTHLSDFASAPVRDRPCKLLLLVWGNARYHGDGLVGNEFKLSLTY